MYPLHEGEYDYGNEELNKERLNERMVRISWIRMQCILIYSNSISIHFWLNFFLFATIPVAIPFRSDPALCSQVLYQEWATLKNWYKKQPLWMIRKYFGVKIGLYFAWLGFYTQALIIPSVVGILCFLFGLSTMFSPLNKARWLCFQVRVCDAVVIGSFHFLLPAMISAMRTSWAMWPCARNVTLIARTGASRTRASCPGSHISLTTAPPSSLPSLCRSGVSLCQV